MKKLLSLLIVTALVLTNSFSIAFADEIENTETTTTLDSSIFEDLDYSYLGEECNETNIETDYNLYDELDYHECEAVYDWIYETYNVSPSDEEANQFIWNNINKFILLAIENEIVIYPKMSTFWFGETHEGIFDKSVNAIKEYSTNAYNFYKNSGCYSNLKNYTAEPDDTEDTPGTHYYVYNGNLPSSDGYYANRFGDYSISARTRFEEHYFTAVNLYKNGFKEKGIKELGYALHYLQDIGCPPHAAGDAYDSGNNNDPHWAFEDFVDNTYRSYYSNIAYSYNATIVDSVLTENIGTNLNALTRIAKDAYDDYADVMTNASFAAAANITMKKTQEYTTAYLIKFFNDINSSSTKYIQDDCYYTIRNRYTSNYLCLINGQLKWSSNKDEACKFYIDIINDYYVIKPYTNAGYIGATSYNTYQVYNNDNSLNRFRFVYNENGYYKIFGNDCNTPIYGKENYKKVMHGNVTNPIVSGFSPTSYACQWQIQKY